MSKALDKNLDTLIHTEPVLQAFNMNNNLNIISTLTESSIQFWFKSYMDHPNECNYLNRSKKIEQSDYKYVDMVKVDDSVIVGDTRGYLNVFKFD